MKSLSISCLLLSMILDAFQRGSVTVGEVQVTGGMLHVSGDSLEDAGQKLQVKLNSLFRQFTI